MGKVKRLELWWQLYRTSLPVWDLENFRTMVLCWHECTCTKISTDGSGALDPKIRRLDSPTRHDPEQLPVTPSSQKSQFFSQFNNVIWTILGKRFNMGRRTATSRWLWCTCLPNLELLLSRSSKLKAWRRYQAVSRRHYRKTCLRYITREQLVLFCGKYFQPRLFLLLS